MELEIIFVILKPGLSLKRAMNCSTYLNIFLSQNNFGIKYIIAHDQSMTVNFWNNIARVINNQITQVLNCIQLQMI